MANNSFPEARTNSHERERERERRRMQEEGAADSGQFQAGSPVTQVAGIGQIRHNLLLEAYRSVFSRLSRCNKPEISAQK